MKASPFDPNLAFINFSSFSFRAFRSQGVHAGYDGYRVELGNE